MATMLNELGVLARNFLIENGIVGYFRNHSGYSTSGHATWIKMDTHRFKRGCELWKAACGAPSRSMALLRVFRRVERLAEQEDQAAVAAMMARRKAQNVDAGSDPVWCMVM